MQDALLLLTCLASAGQPVVALAILFKAIIELTK